MDQAALLKIAVGLLLKYEKGQACSRDWCGFLCPDCGYDQVSLSLNPSGAKHAQDCELDAFFRAAGVR